MKYRLLPLVLGGMLALSACSAAPSEGGAFPSGAPDGGTSLTIAITKDENTLSPFTYVSATGTTVNRLIYDTLFTTDENNEVIPWMVEEDYQAEDSKVFTMTLREGLFFHDGSPVRAEDVKFSFTYPAQQTVAGLRAISKQVESVEILSERTLRFTLKQSDVNFLRDGFCEMRILPKALYENEPDGAKVAATIGSGMYRLAQHQPGQYYRLEAVPDYFAGRPQVDVINMPIMEDPNAVQQGLLAGELDAATSSIGAEVLPVFEKADGYTVYASAGYSPMILNINNGRYPLDQVEFRQALSYGIDVAGIMQTLYGQYALAGTRGCVRSDLPYAVPGLDYSYDPAKANSLLDSLGFTERGSGGIRLDHSGKPLSFTLLVYTNNPIRVRCAELVAGQLKEIGLQIAVQAMEMDTVDAYVWPDFEVSKGRDYDLAMWGWGSSLSMNYLIELCASDYTVGTYNVCGYQSDDFDELLAQEYSEVSSVEQMEELLRKLQAVAAREIPLITFGFADSLQVCNTGVYNGWKPVKGGNIVNIHSFLPA